MGIILVLMYSMGVFCLLLIIVILTCTSYIGKTLLIYNVMVFIVFFNEIRSNGFIMLQTCLMVLQVIDWQNVLWWFWNAIEL